jgi:hypothetical protein
MANELAPDGNPLQLEALLDRWQESLDLHARYAALDDARYWHVQPWPRHERPQRWIIQLARKRILALKRIVAQRQLEGDRACIEGIEIMGFLATLVGLTSVERFIPLATPETERRDVLAAKPAAAAAKPVAAPKTSAAPTPREREATGRTAENRRVVEAQARPAESRRTAETTRQMPALAQAKIAQAKLARREPQRAAPAKPRKPAEKPPTTVTQSEHVVIADAVRLLGWGRQWHELAEMIARLSERPAPSEIRRILRTYREQIDAIATRRGN